MLLILCATSGVCSVFESIYSHFRVQREDLISFGVRWPVDSECVRILAVDIAAPICIRGEQMDYFIY